MPKRETRPDALTYILYFTFIGACIMAASLTSAWLEDTTVPLRLVLRNYILIWLASLVWCWVDRTR